MTRASDSAPPLIGRTLESEAIRRLLEASLPAGRQPAHEAIRSLLLLGDRGVGKTALLHAAGEAAAGLGHRLLPLALTQSQAGSGPTGLSSVITPLLDRASRLSRAHRD